MLFNCVDSGRNSIQSHISTTEEQSPLSPSPLVHSDEQSPSLPTSPVHISPLKLH